MDAVSKPDDSDAEAEDAALNESQEKLTAAEPQVVASKQGDAVKPQKSKKQKGKKAKEEVV